MGSFRNRNSVIECSKNLSEKDTLGLEGELNADLLNAEQVSLLVSENVEKQANLEEKKRIEEGPYTSLLRETLDVSTTLEDGVAAIVDDSFTKCFNKSSIQAWNFNAYLFPLWLFGLLLRYVVLFPIRLITLLVSFSTFVLSYQLVEQLLPSGKYKASLQKTMVHTMCFVWVSTWTAVIRVHGPKPVACKGRVWVSNHTSMIDFLVLSQVTPFATVMQKHPGWLGLVQTYVLGSFGCVQFNRKEAKDRAKVSAKIKDYVHNNSTFPLLIFPEGTCVNNRYCTMFKKGAFDLGATVCPIALKYNKLFVDAFWSSRQQSFTMHLCELMTSWTVIADIYFLEPQTKREDESAIEFASRVQALIAKKARLKIVPWDGMLKYYSPSPLLCEQKRENFASALKARLVKSEKSN